MLLLLLLLLLLFLLQVLGLQAEDMEADIELLEPPADWPEGALATRGSLLSVSMDELFPVREGLK